jgi:hypothetical protein
VLWLAASFPALILVLSFITILLRARTVDTFGAWPHFAGSVHAPVGLTNDGVVVRVGTSSLDSSLQFHRILLSSQQPYEILSPGVAIISDQNLVPRERRSRLGIRPQNCN